MCAVNKLNLTNASAPAALVDSYGFKVYQRYVMRNVKQGLVPGHCACTHLVRTSLKSRDPRG